MTKLVNLTIDELYKHFKKGPLKYHEEVHCKLLMKVMMNEKQGSYSAFCVEAIIGENTFFTWVREHETFRNVYYFCQIVAREVWEQEGRRIRDTEYQIGTVNYSFEHWKIVGWSRFGISRNSRLKLNLVPEDSPAKHYQALLRQAGEGAFTASEFKQLMEAINVGLNVHQVYELQKQIDELKSDLVTMTANMNVQNPFTDKGIAKKD